MLISESLKAQIFEAMKSLFQDEQVLETLTSALWNHLNANPTTHSTIQEVRPVPSKDPLDLTTLITEVEGKTRRLKHRQFLEGDWFSRHPTCPRTVLQGVLANWLGALRLFEEHRQHPPREVLEVLAEAQSAVFALTREDPHQRRTMHFLHQATRQHRVILKRHVKRDDLANPRDHALLAEKISGLLSTKHPGPLNPGVMEHSTQDLVTPCPTPVSTPPHKSKKREKPANPPRDSQELDGTIDEARALLAGKKVVLVGGEVKRMYLEKYRKVFGCQVEWVPAREQENYTKITRKVQQAGGDVVVVLIRWVRHASSHIIEAVRVPVVRLQAGFGVSRLAHAILQQASRSLKDASA